MCRLHKKIITFNTTVSLLRRRYHTESLTVHPGDLPAFTVFPYFIQGLVGLGSGVWADGLVREGKYPVKFIRRAFQTAGMVGPAVCLLAAAYFGGGGSVEGEFSFGGDGIVVGGGGGAGGGFDWLAGGSIAGGDAAVAAAFFVDLGLALSALTLAGVSVSHLDVAPRHAGLVFATGNTCATLAGLVAVPFSGFVLESTGQSWSAVFGVIAGVYLVGAAAWCAWVGDEPLPEDRLGSGE